MDKQVILNVVKAVAAAAVAIAAAWLGLTSCNVTRTVTTESQSVQRGDTSVNIVTRTIESYDATKRIR